MKKAFLFIVLVAIFATTFTSCKTSGYGCRGKESWNGMVRRINRGG